jgi:hypothetical protein
VYGWSLVVFVGVLQAKNIFSPVTRYTFRLFRPAGLPMLEHTSDMMIRSYGHSTTAQQYLLLTCDDDSKHPSSSTPKSSQQSLRIWLKARKDSQLPGIRSIGSYAAATGWVRSTFWAERE